MSGFDSQQGQGLFPLHHHVQTSSPPFYLVGTGGSLCRGKVATHLHLVLRLIHEALPPFPKHLHGVVLN